MQQAGLQRREGKQGQEREGIGEEAGMAMAWSREGFLEEASCTYHGGWEGLHRPGGEGGLVAEGLAQVKAQRREPAGRIEKRRAEPLLARWRGESGVGILGSPEPPKPEL